MNKNIETEMTEKEWAEIMERRSQEGNEFRKKTLAFGKFLEDHGTKITKIIDEIHSIIANNHMSVRDTRLVLNEVLNRTERYSQVFPPVEDLVDIRSLVLSRLVSSQFPAEPQTRSQQWVNSCLQNSKALEESAQVTPEGE